MSNHPRGSCVFMCVFLCIGVLLAMGFSHLWKYSLTDKWMIFSLRKPPQKTSNKAKDTIKIPPPTKIEEPLQVTLSCICSFFNPSISDHPHSLQLWMLSFAWHLNSSPGLEWLHVGKASATPTLTSIQLLNLFLSALLLLQHTHAQTHKGSFSRKRLVPLYLHI